MITKEKLMPIPFEPSIIRQIVGLVRWLSQQSKFGPTAGAYGATVVYWRLSREGREIPSFCIL